MCVVRRPDQRQRGSVPGKLSSDPDVNTAAVALLLGHPNPLDLLGQHPSDFLLSVAVVRQAAKLDADRRKAETEVLAQMIGNEVGNKVSATVSAMVKAMRP
jgi:hypothetical protein